MNKYAKPEVKIVKFETEQIANMNLTSGEGVPTLPADDEE